jgi:hypothetical protein
MMTILSFSPVMQNIQLLYLSQWVLFTYRFHSLSQKPRLVHCTVVSSFKQPWLPLDLIVFAQDL